MVEVVAVDVVVIVVVQKLVGVLSGRISCGCSFISSGSCSCSCCSSNSSSSSNNGSN